MTIDTSVALLDLLLAAFSVGYIIGKDLFDSRNDRHSLRN